MEKEGQGIRIELVILNDGINAAHGVDLINFNVIEIRDPTAGLCIIFFIIDNQSVIIDPAILNIAMMRKLKFQKTSVS